MHTLKPDTQIHTIIPTQGYTGAHTERIHTKITTTHVKVFQCGAVGVERIVVGLHELESVIYAR